MSSPTDDLLRKRAQTHGEYLEHARCTQAIMRALQKEVRYDGLPDIVKESLHMIAHKMGRIVTGNPLIKDHYDDIAGYAILVSKRIVEDGMSHSTAAHHPRTIGADGMSLAELASWHADQARALARAAATIDDLSIGDTPAEPKTDPAAARAEEVGMKGGTRAVLTPAPAREALREAMQGARLENPGPGTPEDGGHHAMQADVETRRTFVVPQGWRALVDESGRATTEIEPDPEWPDSAKRPTPERFKWQRIGNSERFQLAPGA